MVKKIVALMMAGMLVICLAGFAAAADAKADAEAMVKKGIAYVKENGKEKAFAEFSNPKGKFVKGELYIFVVDFKGGMLAHGANQKLIGKNMIDLKDSDGVPFIQEFIKVGKQGHGWVEYKWTNPATKKVEPKIAFVQAAGDMILGCGIYK